MRKNAVEVFVLYTERKKNCEVRHSTFIVEDLGGGIVTLIPDSRDCILFEHLGNNYYEIIGLKRERPRKLKHMDMFRKGRLDKLIDKIRAAWDNYSI